ncbi:MAG: hypothetical protein HY814_14700 [Candidatus Riflebacteria bacterium]|nr:hypothetical protein [Candidatus Riflebacteria bacterium]
METEQREVLFVLPPTADPGFDQRVTLLPDGRLAGSDPTADHLLPAATRSSSHVTLDGRRSVDPLGRTLRYHWTQLAEPPSPRTVTLSGQGPAAVVTFTTELPGDYHFALRVCNGQSCSVWAPTLVRVERLTQRAPTAHLAARNTESGSTVDETQPPLVAQVFDAIELDAGGSTDPEPLDRGHLTYRWEQVAGPEVVLSEPASAVLTFFAPDTHDGRSHDVVFHLYADDGVSRSEAEPVWLRTRPPERAQGQMPLATGLNLVGLPGRPAKAVTAVQLAASTGANFVAQLVARSPGPPRFEVLWAGAAGQSQTVLAAGRGYVVSVPSSRLVSLP